MVACQHFNAFGFGSDIDTRVLNGRGVGRKTVNKGIEGLDKIDKFDIFTNFDYYKIQRPQIMAMDFSVPLYRHHNEPIFDAIVCDPPYGVRARS